MSFKGAAKSIANVMKYNGERCPNLSDPFSAKTRVFMYASKAGTVFGKGFNNVLIATEIERLYDILIGA